MVEWIKQDIDGRVGIGQHGEYMLVFNLQRMYNSVLTGEFSVAITWGAGQKWVSNYVCSSEEQAIALSDEYEMYGHLESDLSKCVVRQSEIDNILDIIEGLSEPDLSYLLDKYLVKNDTKIPGRSQLSDKLSEISGVYAYFFS